MYSHSTDADVELQEPEHPSERQGKPLTSHRTRSLRLNAVSSICLTLFIVLPVLMPTDNAYWSIPEWGWNDFIRFLDPFVNAPLLWWIFLLGNPSQALVIAFSLSSTCYVTGATSHTMSTMFKHSVELIPVSPEQLRTYNYIRDDWEHIISHYIYALGIALMLVMSICAHWRTVYPPLLSWKSQETWLFAWSAVWTTILMTLVGTQLPYGPIVGAAIYGSAAVVLLFILWREGGLFGSRRWMTRPVIQLYAVSCSVALLAMVTWTGIEGPKGRNLD